MSGNKYVSNNNQQHGKQAKQARKFGIILGSEWEIKYIFCTLSVLKSYEAQKVFSDSNSLPEGAK